MLDLFSQPPDDASASEKSQSEEVTEEIRRARLLDKVRGGRDLSSLEERVAFVLARYPETRNSDVTLQLQYWQVFESHLLEFGSMPSPGTYYRMTRLSDIARARRRVQNDLGLFVATSEEVAQRRGQLAEDFRIAHVPNDVAIPGVFVYADESGKNEDHLVVGSVWMIAPGEHQRFTREAAAWKEVQEIDYELHSSSLGRKRLNAYREFIERFVFERGTLGFKAVTVPNRGFSSESDALRDLFYILLREGIRHEHESGRAQLPRQVYYLKDEEEVGSDRLLVNHVQSHIDRDAKTIFEGRLYCTVEDPIPSHADILIQIADLFTWAVNRSLNHPTATSWKGEFARWFLDGVGFEFNSERRMGDRAVRLSLRGPRKPASVVPVIEAPPLPNAADQADPESGSTREANPQATPRF